MTAPCVVLTVSDIAALALVIDGKAPSNKKAAFLAASADLNFRLGYLSIRKSGIPGQRRLLQQELWHMPKTVTFCVIVFRAHGLIVRVMRRSQELLSVG